MGTFICPDDSYIWADRVVREVRTRKGRGKTRVWFEIIWKEPVDFGYKVCTGTEFGMTGKTPEAYDQLLNDPRWTLEILCEASRLASAESSQEVTHDSV